MIGITNIIDSVKDPGKHFRTLGNFFLPGYGDDPVLRAVKTYCDVELSDGDTLYDVRCYTHADRVVAERLRNLASFLAAVDEPVYGISHFHERELLVFDDNGGHRYLDVFISARPGGSTLEDIARECLLGKTRSTGLLAGLGDALCAFARRHLGHGVELGGIKAGRVYIAGSGEVTLSGLADASRRPGLRDVVSLAYLVCLLCLSRADVRVLYFMAEDKRATRPVEPRELLGSCAGVGEFPEPLKELCTVLAGIAEKNGITDQAQAHSLVGIMERAAAVEIGPCSGFSTLLDGFGLGAVAEPDSCKKYLFVGPLCCMLMRAWDGKRWCYLDKNGRVVIPGPFIEAGDFWEGLAVVEVGSGCGVIDREGNYIVAPEYEDVDIDETGNRITVMKDGLSGVLNLSGEPVTGLEYEGVYPVNEGIMSVLKDRRFGYITRDGEPVTDTIYEEAGAFKGGVAQVKLRGREYVIGTDGEIIDAVVRGDQSSK